MDFAIEKGLPFAVVPCCVHERAFPDRQLPCGGKARPRPHAAALAGQAMAGLPLTSSRFRYRLPESTLTAGVFPSPPPFFQVRSVEDLTAWLVARGEAAGREVLTGALPFEGQNTIVYSLAVSKVL